MNKLKDFIYNKNDIIVVLVIMLAAAFIIYDRMEAIMEYPDTVAAQTAMQEAEAQAETQQAVVKITITKNNTLSDVSNMLADAGLVSSADEFTAYAEKQKKDNKIDIGDYEIPKGSDMKTILETITK